jgi:hypothetical protein
MTPKQSLIMWCLIGKQGEALQSEIVPEIKKADREALVTGRYVTSSKRGRSLYLKVEDKGWRWAGENLDAELPRNFQVLRDWLERVRHNLVTNGGTLADFIGCPPEIINAPPKSKKRSQKPAKTPKTETPRPLSEDQIRDRIEDAYLAVTKGRKAESALLSKVRAHLPDLDRATVDAALLRILQGDRKARLGQISDPKALSAADRDAAFSPGGEPFHLLWIEA